MYKGGFMNLGIIIMSVFLFMFTFAFIMPFRMGVLCVITWILQRIDDLMEKFAR